MAEAPSAAVPDPGQAAPASSDAPTSTLKPIPPGAKPGGETAPEGEDNLLLTPEGKQLPKGYKPTLPGVFEAEAHKDIIPKLYPHKRDPVTGKFLKSEERPDLPEGTKPAEGEPVKPAVPEGKEPAAAPVKFLGKDYKSLADVEQAHRTLQGLHRQQIEERRQIVEEVDYGRRAAKAWQDEFVATERRLAALEKRAPDFRGLTIEGSAPPAKGAPDARVAPGTGSGVGFDLEGALADVDMDAFEMIAVHPQGGLKRAGEYLLAEAVKVVSDKLLPTFMAKLDQRLAPGEAERQSQAAQTAQLQSFELVASLKTNEGEVAFPELGDAKALEEIGELWSRSGHDDLSTPQDMIQAIALHRTMKGFVRKPQTVAGGEQVQVPAGPAPGAAASLEADAAGLTPPSRGRASGAPGDRRLSAALDDVNLVDPVLGFQKNRPGS